MEKYYKHDNHPLSLKIELKTSTEPVWFRFQKKADLDKWVNKIVAQQKAKGVNVKDEHYNHLPDRYASDDKTNKLNEHLRRETERHEKKNAGGVQTSFKTTLMLPEAGHETHSVLSGRSIHTQLPTPAATEMVHHGKIRVLHKGSLTDNWDHCKAQLYKNGKLAWKAQEEAKHKGSINVAKIRTMEKHIKHKNNPLSLKIVMKNQQ
eukprot:UN32170